MKIRKKTLDLKETRIAGLNNLENVSINAQMYYRHLFYLHKEIFAVTIHRLFRMFNKITYN